MKFDKMRALKNNVFSTKLTRVEDEDQDCVLNEKRLEDDFGFVELQVGGKFEAEVTKDESSNKLVFTLLTEAKEDAEKLAFVLPTSKVKLIMGAQITYSCDASQEVSRTFAEQNATAMEIAEAKCRIFEQAIEARITEAVNAWKKKGTEFETEVLDSIHIPLA